ncbi:Cyclin-dependent kinase 12 [Datura stramonium]|uniref:Cyclin-dependent kinase 12 n=1 Tax=Datura stramonium TaxID=4076 RepID=A0ABS8RNX7_DATST|nr:Cyclin-dependent kinase 12 [Datura stramonium]
MAEKKEEILHTRRWKPNQGLSGGVPKGIEGELVVAGWPNWLVAVAGDALNGWLPRRADTFEKIEKLARELLHLYLVFDCMEYDLKGIQEQKGVKFSEPEIKCYMNQLLKGLDHCHSRGILHRDVTTSNLLVNKEGILKIADFAKSTFFDPEQSIPLTSRIVTLWYRPPELLLGSNSYGIGVDLWGDYDTLLSVEPEYRGTAALALQGEFFTTEPFACEPSSLPQCPPCKEIDAQTRDNSDRNQGESPAEKRAQRIILRFLFNQRDDQRVLMKEPIHGDHDSRKEEVVKSITCWHQTKWRIYSESMMPSDLVLLRMRGLRRD